MPLSDGSCSRWPGQAIWVPGCESSVRRALTTPPWSSFHFFSVICAKLQEMLLEICPGTNISHPKPVARWQWGPMTRGGRGRLWVRVFRAGDRPLP